MATVWAVSDRGSGCGGVLLMAVAAFFLWKWVDGGGRWTGWIYRDASDLTQEVRLGEFADFEQCQAAAVAALRSLSAADQGDYECGRACRFKPETGLSVCKETRN